LNHPVKKKLILFDRKLLRRIFGPTKERNGTWRIKTNDELYELISHKNTINHKNAQRISIVSTLNVAEMNTLCFFLLLPLMIHIKLIIIISTQLSIALG
jgi:hypothetical protein